MENWNYISVPKNHKPSWDDIYFSTPYIESLSVMCEEEFIIFKANGNDCDNDAC